jgi:protein phosphatase
VGHAEQIGEAFVGKTLMRAVPELIEVALSNGGGDADNCTAIAMTWAGSEAMDMVPPTEAPVSTLVIPDGAVASTIQIPRAGDPESAIDLTDDKIDEAVAEIQRAIQRSAKLIDGK